MARSPYVALQARFGTPLSDDERMAACAFKQDELRQVALLPEALSAEALAASEELQNLYVSAGRFGDDIFGMRGYWELTETHRCGGGNDLLAGALALGLNILLGIPVVEIDVRADGVFVRDGDDGSGSVWEGTDNQPTFPNFGLSVFSGGTHVLSQGDYPLLLGEIFPGYAAANERFVDWPNTPGIFTGYSVPAPNEVTTIAPALVEPHAGRLYIAGEQSQVGFFGYMEGALQSGARAARDIVLSVCPEAF